MRNLVKLICSLILIVLFAPTASANEENKELVILLHGIGHSEWNMAGIESALQKAGYQTLNIGYPSLKKDLGTLSTFINDALKKEKVWDGRYKKVHFTTHSMGGLVLRGYLDKYKSKSVEVKKNSCLVSLANLFHASGFNSSKQVRFVFIVRFNKILSKDFIHYIN